LNYDKNKSAGQAGRMAEIQNAQKRYLENLKGKYNFTVQVVGKE
jgi:hypothetical protein